MERTRKEKGITLVALIITIIVLLILAVVSIRAVQGDGIIQHAINAKSEYEIAQESEEIMLQDYLDVLNINDANASVLEGKGTEEEPYVISSIEDLILFGYDVNCGNNYQGKYVKLEKDLDFNLDESYENPNRTNYSAYGYDGNLKTALTSGEGFNPIGKTLQDYTDNNVFAGVFDGNGKIIGNLRINRESNIDSNIGLFSSNYGVIKDLGIKNCNIIVKGDIICGSLCGYNGGEIISCWSSGDIEGEKFTGGLIGSSKGASIKNCFNKAEVSSVADTTYNVSSGGIVGTVSTTIIENCYNIGNIKSEQLGSGHAMSGGIVAYTESSVKNCYNLGTIKSVKLNSSVFVGGISGYSTSGNFEKLCNVGNILYEGSSTKYVGLILGSCSGVLSESYCLSNAELNGIGRNYSSTPEPTKVDTVEEMPAVLEIVGDGFKEDANNINNGYPILSWQ